MTDVKISGLPNATTPVAGTEILPIVQGGQTRKISIDNLTAGKSVTANSFIPTSSTVPTNGMFLGAANSVSIATNTTEHWMVNASGNLNPVGAKGIGTTLAPVNGLVSTQLTSTIATGTAPLVVTSTTEVANLRAANATSADTANQVKSNATTGLLQIAGPGAGTTRVMTTPNANFTAARTDAGQSFTGAQAILAPYDANNPSTSTVPSLRVNEGGALSLWLGATAYSYVWLQGIQDDGTNTLKDMRLQPLGGNVSISNGNLVIGTSGKGIDFSATAHPAGMTSELLNDYEEGTWTPTVFGSSTAGTATYSNQVGTYTKVGNMVYCQATIIWSGATGTGNLRFGGLPYSSNSTSSALHAVTFGIVSDVTLIASNVLTAILPSNSSTIIAYQTPVGGGSYNDVAMDAAGYVVFSLTYRTA